MTDLSKITGVYNHIRTLVKQLTYLRGDVDKKVEEINETIDAKVDKTSVVNSVIDNNLNPVTSNAVNDILTILKNELTQSGVLNRPTSLTIDVPLSLVYTDFNITGTLTCPGLNSPIANGNVDLLVGDTVVTSTTTDSNGDYTFTKPVVSSGTHTFKVRYSGWGDLYAGCESSSVTREVGKETSVLSITSPSSNSQWDNINPITVTGTLLDNDGESISNATINIKQGNTIVKTLTTNSNGAISGTFINTNDNTSLTFEYLGDDYYTSSSSNVTISIQQLGYYSAKLGVGLNAMMGEDWRGYGSLDLYSVAPETGKNIIIDWDDGTTSSCTDGWVEHEYILPNSNQEDGSRVFYPTVKIYNIDSFSNYSASDVGIDVKIQQGKDSVPISYSISAYLLTTFEQLEYLLTSQYGYFYQGIIFDNNNSIPSNFLENSYVNYGNYLFVPTSKISDYESFFTTQESSLTIAGIESNGITVTKSNGRITFTFDTTIFPNVDFTENDSIYVISGDYYDLRNYQNIKDYRESDYDGDTDLNVTSTTNSISFDLKEDIRYYFFGTMEEVQSEWDPSYYYNQDVIKFAIHPSLYNDLYMS